MTKILYVGLGDLSQSSLCVPVKDLKLHHLTLGAYTKAQEYDIIIFECGRHAKTLKHRGLLLERKPQ